MTDDTLYDVIQLGRGPVGMMSAAVLGRAGHTVALVEKHTGLYGHPRAGHIDHEIARILASLDCDGPVLADADAPADYIWKNAQGEVLITFPWGAQGVSGYQSDYMMFQPLIDQALAGRLADDPKVTALLGWQAVRVEQADNHVVVHLRGTRTDPGSHNLLLTDETRTLRGRWLIASDGAGSQVRDWIGSGREDLGFEERWMVVDARRKRELQRFDPDCGQICDPERPTTILPLGKRHRRWEWYMFKHETNEQFTKPETAWELLARQNVGPDDVEIVRQIVYTFSGKIADTWRKGRIFLMGDAAHTTPPFMGQGMCSGMRDAVNMGWKLDLVLRGLSPDSLLDTYQPERSPHSRDWALIAIEAGKLPCTVDPQAARARDEMIRQGWRPPMPDFPRLRDGVLHRSADGSLYGPVGDLGVQGRVSVGGRIGLLDSFQPKGRFVVLSSQAHPAHRLPPATLAALEPLNPVFCWVGMPGDAGADAIDVDGTYDAYFRQHGIDVLVVRPDFYVFAACTWEALAPSLEDLARQLGLGPGRRSSGS